MRGSRSLAAMSCASPVSTARANASTECSLRASPARVKPPARHSLSNRAPMPRIHQEVTMPGVRNAKAALSNEHGLS